MSEKVTEVKELDECITLMHMYLAECFDSGYKPDVILASLLEALMSYIMKGEPINVKSRVESWQRISSVIEDTINRLESGQDI